MMVERLLGVLIIFSLSHSSSRWKGAFFAFFACLTVVSQTVGGYLFCYLFVSSPFSRSKLEKKFATFPVSLFNFYLFILNSLIDDDEFMGKYLA